VGLVAALIVVVIWASVNTAAFSRGIWLSATLPLAAATPPVILGAAVQLLSGRRRAQYSATRNELLEQFQAPRSGSRRHAA
jgi:adenylate cyclase